MRLIGLTGGIATGKSTVARMLVDRGAVVIDADLLAREVVEPGEPALEEIAAEFGRGVLDSGGRLDRAALGEVVFADPQRRRRLEAITHPRIIALMQQRIAAALQSYAPLVVVDIPLLFENRRDSWMEGVMLVYADTSTQVRRMRERDGFSEEEARRRIAAQMAVDEKRRMATWVIDNGASVDDTRRQVDEWWSDNVAPVGG
ncbi:MAG TPA: dephospho-CoA kinase [Candidatus Dormibacteraeota bacterium]|jgi:dephospho-CoA kinase|nr:dephospho-CoA kinase [Candidatus Dormibacteraeota bacterium]